MIFVQFIFFFNKTYRYIVYLCNDFKTEIDNWEGFSTKTGDVKVIQQDRGYISLTHPRILFQ